MPEYKCTYAVEQDSVKGGACGFTDSFYRIEDTPQKAMDALTLLAQARAASLNANAQIAYLRVADRRSFNKAFSVQSKIAGAMTGSSDMPQTALLVNITNDAGQARPFYHRAMPDDVTIDAKTQIIVGPFGTEVYNFLNHLVVNGWFFHTINDGTRPPRVASIDATGFVTMLDPLTVAAADQVRLWHCKNADNEPIKGTFFVADQPITATTFTLKGWDAANVVDRGRAYKVLDVITRIRSWNYRGTVVKKVGRPFGAFRGRRSRSS